MTRKNVENNVVYISNKYYEPEKKRDTFKCGPLNWSEGDMPAWWRAWLEEGGQGAPPGTTVKLRHGPTFNDIKHLSFGHTDAEGGWQEHLPAVGESWEGCRALVQLYRDDQGLASGQYAVFYHDNVCVGSAVIV